ncbi:chaperonin 10-like protein [Zopfochytrium polystomum]|nr:chaperonin 10-like protein [Zopfochytrium polystomum]
MASSLSSGPMPATMRALLLRAYGSSDVLTYEEVQAPTLSPADPADASAVIIKVKAAGANPADVKIRRGDLSIVFGSAFPMYLGVDYSGEIVSVGPKAAATTGLKPGDEVYGRFGGINRRGAQAEYAKVSTDLDLVVRKPPSLDHATAASVPVAAITAYVGLTLTGGYGLTIEAPGEGARKKSVLVIGASGGVGSWAVVIAKRFGASVTGVASGKNREYVLGLGADKFVDYTVGTAESLFAQGTGANGEPFDIVLDAVGGDAYWNIAPKILKPKGLYATAVGPMVFGGDFKFTAATILSMLGTMLYRSFFASRKYFLISDVPNEKFQQLEQWLKEGSLPVLPKATTMALADAKRAHEVIEAHRTVGKIVFLP